ncbi:hypothetical protein BGZ96_000381 [Linnemannia gamsii]|uniref:FAD-binding domain-containing protein n=1 Tax=Linnemannia gamsii TaxID=64522 RepID=A0ABQ7JQB3_9FUNG|nr:hypothetical protein BGZ96_000381 [Linnemannia gamsii]
MEINPAVTFKHERELMFAKRPKVLIVGAGLGGLTLGAILQKSDIPYDIFERAPKVKPLGSAICFNATMAPFLHQMGLMEEFVSLSKLVPSIQIADQDRQIKFTMTGGFDDARRKYGGETRVIPRPEFYDMILQQVPKERIHFGKKILTTKQGGNGVLLRCSDGTEYEGDILVGADGAHSAVRQNLYAELKKENKLPPSDDVALPFSTICLVGQTKPLTLEEFPHLALDESQFIRMLAGEQPYTNATFTTKRNTVCWSLVQYLDAETSRENDSFRNSEWGPEAAEAMCEQVRDQPVIAGGDRMLTIGDLIDWTPKEYISKVMLEQKVFQTWHSCRTVLIGDACHKLNPSGGVGATNAMHDAIVLANYIHALPHHPIADEIESALTSYQAERIEWVEKDFARSLMLKKMVSKGLVPMIIRFMIKYMPEFMMSKRADEIALVKPALQPSLNLKGPTHQQQEEGIPAQTI